MLKLPAICVFLMMCATPVFSADRLKSFDRIEKRYENPEGTPHHQRQKAAPELDDMFLPGVRRLHELYKDGVNVCRNSAWDCRVKPKSDGFSWKFERRF